METDQAQEAAPEPIRFRPSKKRKTYRQRNDDDVDVAEDVTTVPKPPPAAAPPASTERAVASDFFGGLGDAAGSDSDADDNVRAENDDEDGSVAALAAMRLRNARKARSRGGVGFSATTASSRPGASESSALVLRAQNDDEHAAVTTIGDRFTHQTGLVRHLDERHMNAYIESRLSSRAAAAAASAAAANGEPQSSSSASTIQISRPEEPKNRGQSTAIGKLMEVDLLHASAPAAAAAAAAALAEDDRRPAKKQRLGPDGKPWRGRRRRGSDDVKRDELVDAILSENKLPVYDFPAAAQPPADDADGDADERLAQEFRQQFMDDMAARRQKKKKATTQTNTKQKNEDVLKGPRLGGSRNSRAAVRDALLKKEKETKK